MNKITRIIERYKLKQTTKSTRMISAQLLEYNIQHELCKQDMENLDKLEQLVAIRNDYIGTEKKDTIFNKIDVNTVLKVGAGLVVAGAILKYEDEDIITTKSFGIMSKFIGI